VNSGINQFFGLSKKLSGKHSNCGRSITDLFILSLGNVNEDLGCWVVNKDRLENGCTIIGDRDLLSGVLIAH